MAISLGSIVVDLVAKTSNFVEGMTKASYTAQKSAKEIKGAFADMGASAQALLAPFGEIGGALGGALGGVGATVRAVSESLGGMVSSLGAVGVGVSTVVGAVAALGVAGAGVAAFAARSAAGFYEMSEKTGVSVETLSSFTYAAKQSGVSGDALATGLGRLARSAFAAATAPAGAVNAFTRLGVSLKDSTGAIRPTEDVLLDLSDKFKDLPNGITRSALAQQLFGRSGKDMLPFLIQGREGIKALTDEAAELGVTISGKTASESHQFEQSLLKIEGALQGASNAVLKELLPSMEALVDFIVSDLKDPSGVFRELGSVLLNIVVPAFKVLASAIAVAVTIGDYFTAALSGGIKYVTQLVFSLGDALSDLAHGRFKSAGDELKESFKEGLQDFAKGIQDETGKADARLTAFFAKTWFGADAFKPEKKQDLKDNTDLSPATKYTKNNEEVQKLAAETVKEAELANAIKGTAAATLAMNAAAEAQQIITDLNIAGAAKGIVVTKQQAAAIQDLTLLLSGYKSALDVNKSLDDSIKKTEESAKAANMMAGAYLQGADAVEKAKEQVELLPFEKQVSDLQAVYEQLAKTSGGFAELQAVLKSLGPEGAELSKQFKALGINDLSSLRTAIKDADDKLVKLRADIPLEVAAKTAEEAAQKIKELADNTDAHIRSLQEQNAAILAGGQALKSFNLEQQLQKDFPKVTADNVAAYEAERAKLEQIQQLEIQQSAVEKVASELKYKQLQQQIDTLNTLRQTVKAGSDQQRAIDAALHDDLQEQAKDYDQLLLKTNSMTDGFKAFFIDLATQGKTAAQQINDVMTQMLDGINTNFAKFLTGQKTGWKALGKSIEESLAKSAIGSVEKSLAGSLTKSFGGIFGLGGNGTGKPDGSKANPFFMFQVGGPGGAAVSSGIPNPFNLSLPGLSGSSGAPPDGTQYNPFYVTTSDNSDGFSSMFGSGDDSDDPGDGSGSGGFMSMLAGLFGGGRAGGGDVTPGKFYVVGEKQPELFSPGTAGKIMPQAGASGSVSSNPLIVNNHFHGVSDMDSFKKSSAQINSMLGNGVARAQQRLRR